MYALVVTDHENRHGIIWAEGIITGRTAKGSMAISHRSTRPLDVLNTRHVAGEVNECETPG